MNFARMSKFRNVFCDAPTPEHSFTGLKFSTSTGESNYIETNSKYAVYAAAGGGGPFSVLDLAKPGRQDKAPTVNGHGASCLNFAWNTFDENILASCSEDTTIKLWKIDEEMLSMDAAARTHMAPVRDLDGHGRKVTHAKFHPTASNIMASVGGEHNVKLWDVEAGACVNENNTDHADLIQDLSWDYLGNLYATSCKDKTVRIIDARSGGTVCAIEGAHEGSKACKLTYCGRLDRLLTVGFTKHSQRQFRVWDPRDTSKPLKTQELDQSAGVMMPFFDVDTNMLYLAGKGDGNIRYFEIGAEGPSIVSECGSYRSTVSARGMAMVPKRGLDITKNETCRLLKLTTNSVEPLSFTVPRISDSFQEDLYPDTAAAEAAHSGAEWLAGSTKMPKVFSLDPNSDHKVHDAAAIAAAGAKYVAPKTAASLQKELDAANAKIAELEAKLKEAGIA